MSTPVDFTFGNLPDPYCFSTPQQFATDIFALISGTVNVNGIVISQTVPVVGDRGKLWVKLDSSGRPIGQFYFLGSWIWPYPSPPSGKERRMYAGADGAGDLWIYDNGDGTDPAGATPTTGSFWAIDHDFDFKIPMGPGTNGATYDGNPATVLAQGANLGAERAVLDVTELPAIQLGLLMSAGASGYFGSIHSTDAAVVGNVEGIGEAGLVAQNRTLTDYLNTPKSGGTVTATKSHTLMPPVKGIYMIKRSARIFIVGG